MSNIKMEFCTECRKNTPYTLQKQTVKKTIKGHTYDFSITLAVCHDCGCAINIPGLIDKNIQEIDRQYRAYEGLASVADIEKLKALYDIGTRPLSLALGFGEITVERYLRGQMPSRAYSNVIQLALANPAYMKQKLEENRGKLTDVAYAKAMNLAQKYERDFTTISDPMQGVLSRLVENKDDITPLELQKLLYFTQAVFLALYGKVLFPETFQAWRFGPVHPGVYNMFKSFGFRPIEDARFAIIRDKQKKLTEEEIQVVDLVLATFGRYSGEVLRDITHAETPWLEGRGDLEEDERSSAVISNESIAAYYKAQDAVYDFSSKKGLQAYIHTIL
ncbi:MAG: DUF4065 domain-containing protein [Clostridiales bacterium]|nr:DUF4065 domain-containing protein [Clostridiales bacterium]